MRALLNRRPAAAPGAAEQAQRLWDILRHVPKFTPRAALEQQLGMRLLPLADRPACYCGGGFVVCWSPSRTAGVWQAEPGERGEYAVSLYHFADADALRIELGLDSFTAEDAAPLCGDLWGGVVSYSAAFGEIHRWARTHTPRDYWEGETRRLTGGKMVFKNRFIQCGPYEFYFFGKSRRTRLTGFRFVFPES